MTIRGKWAASLVVVLVLSLALNLFVAGFAASRWHGPGRSGAIEHMIGAFVTRMPRELRHLVRDELHDVKPELRREFGDLMQARQRMFSLMRAEPLDDAALEAAMSDVRRELNDVQAVGQQAVLAAIKRADPAVRAEILDHRHGGWWRRWRGRDRD